MDDSRIKRINFVANSLIIVVVTIASIYYASNLIMTVIFAAFMALALQPWCEKLEDKGFNRTVAVLIVVVGIALFLILTLGGMALQTSEFVGEMPGMEGGFMEKINDFSVEVNKMLGMDSTKDMWSPKQLLGNTSDAASYAFGTLGTVLFFIVTVPVYVFFMLQYRDNFTAFLKIGADNTTEIKKRMRLIEQIKDAVQSYIRGMGIVLIFVAMMSCIAYLLLGLPHAIFLGCCSAILALIPYLGVYLSALIPAFVALATKDSLWYPAGVLLSVMVIQFIEGNIVTPKIVGNEVDLNPLVVVMSIVVIGFIGGILGMILAVPIVAIIKIILDSNPNTRHYGLVLGTNVDLNSNNGIR